jgi:undecaprenyl diphosphate synthase
MTVEVIEPHGLCAGVNAAVAKALKLRDVYCLHELVHNEIVVGDLKALGYTFVDRVEDVPEGKTVVFSAHGVPPRVREVAAARHLKIVDATCPFVTKVHRAAKAFADRGLPVVILGDPKHVEFQGIAGEVGDGKWMTFEEAMEAGQRTENSEQRTSQRTVNSEQRTSQRIVNSEQRTDMVAEASRSGCTAGKGVENSTSVHCSLFTVHSPRSPFTVHSSVGVVSQTTMNSDEVARQVAELKKRFRVETQAQVCHATQERQDAVRNFKGDAVLVLGSRTSSNSRRLAEVAERAGAKVFLAGTMDEVRALDFAGVETLGVTSGASTPERFFVEAVRYLKNVPQHVAIIMDGNGRWATQRGKKRGEGHKAGAKTLGDVLKWCGDRGIKYLTVYAFSTENWKRPKEEVDGLMTLFARMLKSKESSFMKNRVRFRMVGRRGDLSKKLLGVIEALERKTAHFERQFVVAISYGGRAEIVDAANAAMKRGEPLTEETFRSYLYAPDVPDPDLVIRTSGELRTSNFLLWESAYSEYYFTDTLWPDFTEAELDKALASYAERHRRKGGV